MEKTGFFEESPGVKSSSRLNATIVIWGALAQSLIVVLTTVFTTPSNIIPSAVAAGSLFVTLAGSAMLYQFKQKQTEENIGI